MGQEDVEEVISRDIHRTFPEYPMFALQQVGWGRVEGLYLCLCGLQSVWWVEGR